MTAKEQIEQFVDELLQDSDVFLIRSSVSNKNDVKVYLDSDTGLPINVISKINRALYKKIEEAGLFPEGDFSLEVSSPGVDEPLVFNRQYKKHIGRNLEINLTDNQSLVGKLISVDEAGIQVEITKDKKKKLIETREIPYSEISKAIVQISF